MIENISLPQDLSIYIGSERKDFAVKAGLSQPAEKSFPLIIFGIVSLAFIAFIFLGIYQKEGIHFGVNKVPSLAGLGNLGSFFMSVLIIIILSSFSVGMLGYGIYSLFKKGGYFIGTPTRLVNYQKGNIRSIDWEQFSGEIKVTGNARKGNISLQMRTGRMVSRKREPDYYVPDVIYISGIPNVFEIEQICRKRIKENDPTPPLAIQNIT